VNSPIGRKIRTERILKEIGIPINKNLPALVNDGKFRLRTKDEVINRIISITITSAKGSGAPDELIDEYIKKYDAMDMFTSYEKEFILSEDPDQDELNYYLWKIECNSALLWAIQCTPTLSFPSDPPDVEFLYRVVLNSSREELLNQADLFFI